jgi:hypothetical protein
VCARAYRLRIVLEEAHRVLNDDLVLESDELNDLGGDPGPDHLELDLAHVHFAVKLGRELERLEQLELLVGEAPVLVGGRALEEA